MTKLLIVDDNEQNLYMLQVLLKGYGYEVETAGDGAEALEKARHDAPDVVITDILMPVMDGFTLCREWKKADRLKEIPFIFYTATYTDPRDEEFALSLGAERFIVKPVEPGVFVRILREVIREAEEGRLVAPRGAIDEEPVFLKEYSERLVRKLEDKMLQLEEANRALETEIAERKRAEEELLQSYVKLQRTLEGTVNTLVLAVEMRDPYTAGHQRGVAQLACAIAKEMGLSENQIEGIRMAALIHDIGKISIPAEVLNKPGPLSELEYGLIKAHPQIGHDILKAVDFPWPVADIVLEHHERMDGSGYPQGLSGEEIILEARILGVADVVEAMVSHRPYRPAHEIDEALEEISQNRGVIYDPEVVDACLRLFSEKGFELE
jgi:putative two-component system response regulator